MALPDANVEISAAEFHAAWNVPPTRPPTPADQVVFLGPKFNLNINFS